MTATSASLPGVYFEVQPPLDEQSPLRTDIAAFAGVTRRGPVGAAQRITGWQQFLKTFGGIIAGGDLALALRGYFENGGEIAHVVRLAGAPLATASGQWDLGTVNMGTMQWVGDAPAAGAFEASSHRIHATSPGKWGNDIKVDFRYRRFGDSGEPQVDIVVRCPGEETEYIAGIPPAGLIDEVAARSSLIRLEALALAPAPEPVADSGPLRMAWTDVTTTGGLHADPTHDDYLAAAEALSVIRESALIAFPDLHSLAGEQTQQRNVLAVAIAEADSKLDRQVIATLPRTVDDVAVAQNWMRDARLGFGEGLIRSLAIYHPWIAVEDPAGDTNSPHRNISPVGHIAGVISRLDRERGAHYTPANVVVDDAIDVTAAYSRDRQALLLADGVNLIRCQSGRGLQVWGGKTAADPRRHWEHVFLAHRRLIHRLVRAIRRVAEPLVFDVNGPALRLTLVRAITGVLLEAFRAGGLKGDRPEEGFRVVCDESNNPEEEQDLGRVHCEICVAPAVPMEFIVLQVTFSTEGQLEVIAQ